MTDLRVCNTSDLRVLASRTDSRIPPTLLVAIDPDGNHVLRRVLFGHNMDAPNSKLHHRVVALCKIHGTKEPFELRLDVLDEDWNRLATMDEVLGMTTPAQMT